jgi:hypothetical protein
VVKKTLDSCPVSDHAAQRIGVAISTQWQKGPENRTVDDTDMVEMDASVGHHDLQVATSEK